jgi:hypothetical protein
MSTSIPSTTTYKEVLGCRGYIRYMDDLCLFSDSKEELWAWLEALLGCLATLRLLPKMAKTRIFSTGENIGFLGVPLSALPSPS